MKSLFKRLAVAAATAGLFAAAPGAARAEGKIAIVEQFGTLYLPLHVIRDQKLIEKHGKELGLDIEVEWRQLSGGSAVNDALLSGSIDIASAGIGPFLTLWDRTKGQVKIIGALGAQPNYLLTNRADIKSLRDFKPGDKIASPAAGVSVQSRVLQIAAEKEFGVGHHAQLADNEISLPHPDATAALLSGSTEVVGHISNSPFQDQALLDPKIHKVWSSYDILGGPVTPTHVYTTLKFRAENPKTYQAFLAAFREATDWVAANREAAADTYIRVTKSKLEPAFVLKLLNDPEVRYTTVPQNTFKFAEFLYRTGQVKLKAESWKDYTFEDLHDSAGS
ncbi:NitT/TauT family transport system substrate-binding protein [Zavarzinia compransoris]|uniref:Nitrate ABC transporter substrate-binding protein n=2 Tax=Zavarzinia compransoris TaxID=1264899 RepID=A0A317E1V5_9PROT|nr:nitrate ABC transporter substrate-binding protein [Zavarzinia compransoris]TDP45129.1 NitT/TauT family transport system substrate-binding protein [Zavarzinia compransoris]